VSDKFRRRSLAGELGCEELPDRDPTLLASTCCWMVCSIKEASLAKWNKGESSVVG